MNLWQAPICQRLHFTQRLHEQVTRGAVQADIAGTDRVKRLYSDIAQAPMFVRVSAETGLHCLCLAVDATLAGNAKGGNRSGDGIVQAAVEGAEFFC